MKIKFEFDDNLTDTEIVIKAAEDTAEIQRLAQLLEANATTVPKFTFYKDDSEYYLSLNTILFFETDERAVHAHTANDVFTIKYRLYELESSLPDSFIRISKSAIVNVAQIFALTCSLSNVLIEFQDSHKQIYAFRRYAKQLKDKLNQTR